MPAADSASSDVSVGALLRSTRESRGILLEEAARVTRIGQNYLRALEDEMYSALPSPAYTRGFLRAYAAFLGMSGDQVVAMYEQSLSPAPIHSETINGEPHAADGEIAAPPRKGRWFVPVVLLTLVVVAAFIFDERNDVRDIPPSAPPAKAIQAAAPLLPARSSVQKASAAVNAPYGKETGVPGRIVDDPQNAGLVLKLKVNQDSWLNITIDDTFSQQYDLKAGDLIEWKGERAFALDLGNGGGIEAELNGKPQKSFGETGKPAHVVLTAIDAVP